jgi:hypothetical protein
MPAKHHRRSPVLCLQEPGSSSLVSLFQFSSPLFPQSTTSVSGFVGEEAGEEEEEGGCLYVESEF